jgi:two-component system LytT family sensor kinase
VDEEGLFVPNVPRPSGRPLLDSLFAVTTRNWLARAKHFLSEDRNARRWGRVWAVSLGIWVGLDVLVQTQNYSWYREKGIPVPWPKFLGDYIDSAFWAFLTPLILLAVSRVPIERRTWRKAVPVHLLAGLAASAFWLPQLQASRLLLAVFFDDASLYREVSLSMCFRVAVEGLLLYTQVLAIGHGMHYYREYTARDLSASRLEGQLAQAQLQILRMQLHPHFLFNTLNTISALIHKDVRAADRMLALLGDLLRDSFEKLGAQEVALKQELDFLDRYLEIEQTRFQDRLVVDKEIAPETLDAMVPNLILQPLVENAIRHGIARRAGAGRIELCSWRDNGMLAVRIRDDGPGLPTGTTPSTRGGVGLSNSQARLEQLYGPNHRFELSNRPEGGFEVILGFPFRSSP